MNQLFSYSKSLLYVKPENKGSKTVLFSFGNKIKMFPFCVSDKGRNYNVVKVKKLYLNNKVLLLLILLVWQDPRGSVGTSSM